MSIDIVAYVRDFSKATGSAHHLLLVIASNINSTLGYAWPSIAYLAQRLDVTPRRIHQILHELEASGQLIIEHGGGRRTNRYRIPLPDDRMKSTDEMDCTPPLKPIAPHPGNGLHGERVVRGERKKAPIAIDTPETPDTDEWRARYDVHNALYSWRTSP